jgi:hypothetical protein
MRNEELVHRREMLSGAHTDAVNVGIDQLQAKQVGLRTVTGNDADLRDFAARRQSAQ